MSTAMPSSAATPSGRRAMWTARLETINNEVQSLIDDRNVWHTVSDIGAANAFVRANPFFMGYVNTLYYRRALHAVRAMVDANTDSASIITLLTDIAAHPGDLEITDSTMQTPGATTIDPTKVIADRDRLVDVAAKCKKYVNKFLAHIDAKGNAVVPTAPEIDAAVELIGELLVKYTQLITGAGLKLGTNIFIDWTVVFTKPWIEDSAA